MRPKSPDGVVVQTSVRQYSRPPSEVPAPVPEPAPVCEHLDLYHPVQEEIVDSPSFRPNPVDGGFGGSEFARGISPGWSPRRYPGIAKWCVGKNSYSLTPLCHRFDTPVGTFPDSDGKDRRRVDPVPTPVPFDQGMGGVGGMEPLQGELP